MVGNWLGCELAFTIVGAVGNNGRVADGWDSNEPDQDVVDGDVCSFGGFSFNIEEDGEPLGREVSRRQ